MAKTRLPATALAVRHTLPISATFLWRVSNVCRTWTFLSSMPSAASLIQVAHTSITPCSWSRSCSQSELFLPTSRTTSITVLQKRRCLHIFASPMTGCGWGLRLPDADIPPYRRDTREFWLQRCYDLQLRWGALRASHGHRRSDRPSEISQRAIDCRHARSASSACAASRVYVASHHTARTQAGALCRDRSRRCSGASLRPGDGANLRARLCDCCTAR